MGERLSIISFHHSQQLGLLAVAAEAYNSTWANGSAELQSAKCIQFVGFKRRMFIYEKRPCFFSILQSFY